MTDESDHSQISQRRASARANDDPEYRARRAEILQAAARVFRERGYQAAKIKDIADAIGKDRASLYYYTTGKEELFQEIVADAVLDNVLMVERLQGASIPAPAKLEGLIKGLMSSYQKHSPYLFVYVQEPMAHLNVKSEWGRRMSALGRRFDNAVRAIIQEGIDEGSIHPRGGDARLIANGIIGMCNWSHRWFHPTGEDEAMEVGKVFSAMVLNGLVRKV